MTIRPFEPQDNGPLFSYSGDPASSGRDGVRFLVQDTDGSMPLLSDAEYDYLIEQWMPRYDSLIYVASVAAATISRKFVGIVSVSADGVSVNTSDLAQRYRDLASQLHQEYQSAQATGVQVDITNLMVGQDIDFSIAPLRFGVGVHDNVEAGQQDYGGRQGASDEAYRW